MLSLIIVTRLNDFNYCGDFFEKWDITLGMALQRLMKNNYITWRNSDKN